MKRKKCKKCGKTRLIKFFSKYATSKTGYQANCKTCNSVTNALFRLQKRDYHTEYNRTERGFLIKTYHNMLCRVNGVHGDGRYAGLDILPKIDFITWSLNDPTFNELFHSWKRSGYQRRVVPSIERIFTHEGYIHPNIEWLTLSENVQNAHKYRKW